MNKLPPLSTAPLYMVEHALPSFFLLLFVGNFNTIDVTFVFSHDLFTAYVNATQCSDTDSSMGTRDKNKEETIHQNHSSNNSKLAFNVRYTEKKIISVCVQLRQY